MIKNLTMRLVLAQSVHGAWTYEAPKITPELEDELFSFLKDLGSKSWEEYRRENPAKVSQMSADLKKLAILQNLPTPTPPLFFQDGGDNSNTQIALLALWSVRRKLPVDHALRLTVRRFRESQQPDGHWKYSRGQEGEWRSCAMTCAGLLALAIGHALDLETTPDKKPHKGLKDKQIDAGMRFVGNVIGSYIPAKSTTADVHSMVH